MENTTRKTKAELLEELEEAKIKIRELNLEVEKLDSFVSAGFSNEEAFKLVLESLKTAVRMTR